jgi:hypothetical protein
LSHRDLINLAAFIQDTSLVICGECGGRQIVGARVVYENAVAVAKRKEFLPGQE